MSKKKKYTKYDKHKKLITKIARQGDTFGVDKITDVPKACEPMFCKDCLFHDSPHTCVYERKSWLNSKYEEPKRVFTDEQKNFIRACDKIKFLARDYNGKFFAYSAKPNRNASVWIGNVVGYVPSLTFITFPQIKWSDDEPTSREEILGE